MFAGEIVLLTLCGRSPAVVTETVYTLAQRQPVILPNRVIAFTTSVGREHLVRELFDPGRWARLRKLLGASSNQLRFGPSSDSVRVIPRADHQGDLRDLSTIEDNEAAADFLLEGLRGVAAQPDTEIWYSVAGGRKTMSVLAALTMSLLGRSQDHLCHVLVSPPFDQPDLQPRFYFPDPEITEYVDPQTGKSHQFSEATIHLAEIPFIPLSPLFAADLHRAAGGYMSMVRSLRDDTEQETFYPKLRLAVQSVSCEVNSVTISLNELEFCLLLLLARRAQAKVSLIEGVQQLYSELKRFLHGLDYERYPRLSNANSSLMASDFADDLRKKMFRLKRKLQNQLPRPVADQLDPVPERGRYGLRPDKAQIEIIE